ncbi:DUF349 domain-containing protein [Psychromicrobium lacuslunae]|uniref:ATPase n=1 Tax=Psychromicrobium lacuslunae TaxID=1618207 RepID=A0A0D4C2Q4_9MICC|nr:DUF349 domain-containing protein [Psychromicrobium lacuslunae]AJT42883.1 ATPase [Psychromicrobium lacuslunae]
MTERQQSDETVSSTPSSSEDTLSVVAAADPTPSTADGDGVDASGAEAAEKETAPSDAAANSVAASETATEEVADEVTDEVTEQAAASESLVSSEPSKASNSATPKPTPAPTAVPSPAAFAARPKPPTDATKLPAAPVAAPASLAVSAEAARFGRAEEDGHVFLILDGEEVPVGQYPGASKDEALGYFVRKFEDLLAQVVLLEQRVEAKAPSTDMHKTVSHLRSQLAERNAVGDVRSTEARLDALESSIKALQQAERAQHEAVRSAELASREGIVAEAEAIAAQDPATVQWKTGSTRMNELFDAWKLAQKDGVRLGKATEDALWKRFRAARTVFDRHRRAFFSQLDSANALAKSAKETLIQEAEALSDSTDWGATAGEYRRLMDRWKAAPRASKKEDDALWTRFRAAQEKFFEARQRANAAIDEEYAGNLVVKEALIAEAKALLPITDLNAAKKALQSIRDRWEDAGKVPRADMQRVEAGLRSVEDAVRKADEEHWKRTDPEAKARTNSALSQLEAAISDLQQELAKAQAKGDAKKIKDAEEALAARQAWLEQIRKSADELS